MITRTSFLSITILVMVFCYSGQAADNSAVLYFAFDEGKGNDVKDGSPAQNDGKVQGDVKWVKGKIGQAMRFDGKGFVEIPHTEDLNLTKAHTIIGSNRMGRSLAGRRLSRKHPEVDQKKTTSIRGPGKIKCGITKTNRMVKHTLLRRSYWMTNGFIWR